VHDETLTQRVTAAYNEKYHWETDASVYATP
jgi:hypothetical protein